MRPRKIRRINFEPEVRFFKPQGIPMRFLEIVDLEPEEIEAMRLKNIEGLDQKEAAKKMNVSQSTFQRILSSGYKKVTKALVSGQAIKIR